MERVLENVLYPVLAPIHLLRAFVSAQTMSNDKLMWYALIHLTFVLSALGMACGDNMNKHR
jgi:uncharacterized protein (TIGR00645 family)